MIDPPGRNWLVNWNNVPAKGWTSGDAPAREQLNGPYHRVAMLQGLVQQAAADPSSFDRATIAVVRDMSRTATQRPTAQAALQGAAAGATGPAADVLNTLLAWDGDYTRTGSDGKVEPGVATWEAFKAAAQVVALGEPTPATRGTGRHARATRASWSRRSARPTRCARSTPRATGAPRPTPRPP